MDRKKIKIIEFDKENTAEARSLSNNRHPGGDDVKIREFGLGEERPPRPLAPLPTAGKIKIVEFDTEARPRAGASRLDTGARAEALPAPSSINIVEYDFEGRRITRDKKEERRNGIKIIEF